MSMEYIETYRGHEIYDTGMTTGDAGGGWAYPLYCIDPYADYRHRAFRGFHSLTSVMECREYIDEVIEDMDEEDSA